MEKLAINKREVINIIINASLNDIDNCNDLDVLKNQSIKIGNTIYSLKSSIENCISDDWKKTQIHKMKYQSMFLSNIQHRIFVVKTNYKINSLINELNFWKQSSKEFNSDFYNSTHKEYKESLKEKTPSILINKNEVTISVLNTIVVFEILSLCETQHERLIELIMNFFKTSSDFNELEVTLNIHSFIANIK